MIRVLREVIVKEDFPAPSKILAGLTTTVLSDDSGNPVGPATKTDTAVTPPMPDEVNVITPSIGVMTPSPVAQSRRRP